MGLGLDYLDKRADLINAISLEDVRRVARRLCDPAKMTVVVAGTLPKRRGIPASRGRGEDKAPVEFPADLNSLSGEAKSPFESARLPP